MTQTPAHQSSSFSSALPDTVSDMTLPGLEGEIVITRDSYGIPHVKAESEHDAYFGQGFATAQDRLWHMDYDRARAYGRWAEFIGPDGVEHDLMMRRFQIRASVEEDWSALSEDARAMFEAYANGVNAFIESADTLPVEYALIGAEPETWRPRDCLAVFKVRHIMMGVFEGKTWRAKLVNTFGPERATSLLKGYGNEWRDRVKSIWGDERAASFSSQLVIVPPGTESESDLIDGIEQLENGLAAVEWLKDDDSGSNNWAVHGSRTASGKPLVAGDPHRGLDAPNVYYQNHVACPDFDVIGLSFPGCPGFPHFGHNDQVAWCVTHAGADYQDLYVENLRYSEQGPEYEFLGEWHPAIVSDMTITVRGEDPVALDVVSTGHGPIIAGSEDGSMGLAFRYTATTGPNRGFECLRRMLHSQNVDEIDESMRDWVDPCNNFVFADVHGDIGYLNRGQVPVRSMANAWLPVPGWTGDHEWEGMIPFEDLARIRNPEDGLIVTANNRIVGEDYPYYISLSFAPDHRARRILDRLNGLQNATVEDMAAIHSEIVSIPAQVYSKFLANLSPEGMSQIEEASIEHLKVWDGSMDRDLVAPTIYSAIRSEIHGRYFSRLFGRLSEDALGAQGRGAPGHLRQLASLLVADLQSGVEVVRPPDPDWEWDFDSELYQGFYEAVHRLSRSGAGLGRDVDSWKWGDVHRTRPRHPLSAAFPDAADLLDPPGFGMSGDGDTPQAGSYGIVAPESSSTIWDSFTITGTSVARYVWDTSDWDNSRWIVPLGSSGHAGSPHYADQGPVWADVELIPATYSWERIQEDAESVQIIRPVPEPAIIETSPTVSDVSGQSPDDSLYHGSAISHNVVVQRDVMVEMRDGARLATDLYLPAIDGVPAPGLFPVILERTPYDKLASKQTSKGKFFARRGYVVAIQDVRGRFNSEGDWLPFFDEAEDGYDTVEWLGTQSWSDGKVGTMGDSYAGSDQAALATLNPPHLSTMIVAVGASDYFSSSMRHNGALEQRFLIYAYRMATTSPEAKADPALGAALLNIFENGMPEVVENFPILKDTSILRRVPTVEQWIVDLQTVGERTDYWKQRGYAPCEYYDEHADVPTLYLGGWYDSYARNSTECYMKLSRLKDSPQKLLMGPWTHGQYEVTYSGDIDFGLTAHIDYNDVKLAWFDHYLKGMRTEVADWSPVRYFTMGGGDGRINDEHRLNHSGFWTGADDWPVPGTRFVPYYVHGDGTLSRKQPGSDERPFTSYVFDPSDPVPTIGGGISAANPIMEPGAYDQRGDPTRFYGTEDHQPLNTRPDVLTYQTPPLEVDVEVTGPITVRLWASSSAVDTDFTAKLIDVYPDAPEYPEGLAINITDSIIRARYRNGYDEPEFMEPGEIYEFEFELYPTSNTFAAEHRIRVDISSSNWPRFDVNHNTGEPLGVDRTYETAHQTIHHSPGLASHIVLPVSR